MNSHIAKMNLFPRLQESRVEELLGYFPVTAILGPRQCGKTTLARSLVLSDRPVLYLDLERPSDAAKLSEPEAFLSSYRDYLVCLDEIQRVPNLFPLLRSLCDETGKPGQFLVLGSASPDLLRQSSESLAGRIGLVELTPLIEQEVGKDQQDRLWFRGGFPRSFLAPSDSLSRQWLDNFIQTYLERDVPQLGIQIPSVNLRRFWEICAHLNGDLWSHAKVASALGLTGKTAAHYLDILEQSYMVRRLPAWSANTKKRLIKSPKVYLRDTGVLHRLLRIEDMLGLFGHPVRGTSWETYVLEQVASAVPDAELSFFRSSGGAEIDLLVSKGGKTTAIEMKASVSPKLERGFWSALQEVGPDKAYVAAPVKEAYPMKNGVTAVPVHHLCEILMAG